MRHLQIAKMSTRKWLYIFTITLVHMSVQAETDTSQEAKYMQRFFAVWTWKHLGLGWLIELPLDTPFKDGSVCKRRPSAVKCTGMPTLYSSRSCPFKVRNLRDNCAVSRATSVASRATTVNGVVILRHSTATGRWACRGRVPYKLWRYETSSVANSQIMYELTWAKVSQWNRNAVHTILLNQAFRQSRSCIPVDWSFLKPYASPVGNDATTAAHD